MLLDMAVNPHLSENQSIPDRMGSDAGGTQFLQFDRYSFPEKGTTEARHIASKHRALVYFVQHSRHGYGVIRLQRLSIVKQPQRIACIETDASPKGYTQHLHNTLVKGGLVGCIVAIRGLGHTS
jgi:hypothetical protein